MKKENQKTASLKPEDLKKDLDSKIIITDF